MKKEGARMKQIEKAKEKKEKKRMLKKCGKS